MSAVSKDPSERVKRYRWGPYDRVVIDGVDYVPRSSNEDFHILARAQDLNMAEPFAHEKLNEMRADGRLLHFKNFYSYSKASLRARDKDELLRNLPMQEQQMILWRKDLCDRFRTLEKNGKATRSDASIEKALETIARDMISEEMKRKSSTGRGGSETELKTRKTVAPSTFRGFLREYEKFNCEEPLALRDHYGRSGNRVPRLDPAIYELLNRTAEGYAHVNRPTITSLFDSLEIELKGINDARALAGELPLTCPSIESLKRRIRELNVFRVCLVRDEAKAKRDFFMVGRGHRVEIPGERAEMDGWNVSLKLLCTRAGIWSKLSKKEKAEAQGIRIWISAAIDCATRCIVGFYVMAGSPNSDAAIRTLQLAVSDKTALAKAAGCKTPWDMGGVMDTLCTDLGSEYISHETRAAATDLSIEMMYPPAGVPQMRGRIERVFRSFHTQLISLFFGRMFENPIAKGDYDDNGLASVDVDELTWAFVRYIVDVYHNTPHKGLKGETPRNAWLRLTKKYHEPMTIDPDVARQAFGTTVVKLLRREGIEIFGNFYQDNAIFEHFCQVGQNHEVNVRVDQENLGHISVEIPKGWVTVECMGDGMEGLSLHQWEATQEKLRLEFGQQAAITNDIRLQAIAEIREFADYASRRAQLNPPRYSSENIVKLASGMRVVRNENIADNTVDFLHTAPNTAMTGSTESAASPVAVEAIVPASSATNASRSSTDDYGMEN